MNSGPNQGLQFRIAAAKGDIKQLEALYQVKPGLLNLAGQPSGYAAIHQAAAKGQVQTIQWLLKHGADYQLEAANGKNASETALECHQFAAFVCIYNHQHKLQAPLLADNPVFKSRTARFRNKPLIIASSSNENIMSDLMKQPGFIFSEYSTIAQCGMPNVRMEALPSHVAIHDVDFPGTLTLSTEQRTHPDFIHLQYHHAAVRIAELAEKLEGGIVVLASIDVSRLLHELNQLYPNADKLFERYQLPEAQISIPATSYASQSVQPSPIVNIDEIRGNAQVLARSSFDWGDIAGAEQLFIDALVNFQRFIDIQKKLLGKVSHASSSTSRSSSSGSLKSLLKIIDDTFSFETAMQLIKDYFKIANHPQSPKKASLLHRIEKQFFPIYFHFKQDHDIDTDHSISCLCAFYFIIKGELFSEIDFELNPDIIFKSLCDDMLDVGILALNFQFRNIFNDSPIFAKMLSFSIKRSRAQLYVINPEYAILEEFKSYIDLKNSQPYATANIELLFSWTEENIRYKPGETLIRLANRIKDGLQDRTQVIYFADPNHAMLIDIAWDNIKRQFKCIMVDPSRINKDSIKLVKNAFKSHQISARFICLTDQLQRDMVSCVNYALIFSTMTSHYTFDELYSLGSGNGPIVQNFPTSLLGHKTILLEQSSKVMTQRLSTLHQGNRERVEDKIRKWKTWYGETANGKINYLAYRRQSLHDKVMNTKKPITTKEILLATSVDDISAALRQLAAGAGSGAMLTQLLSQLSQQVINETGSLSGKSSLHFAYERQQHSRVARLLAHGADPELKDREGKKPREYKKP